MPTEKHLRLVMIRACGARSSGAGGALSLQRHRYFVLYLLKTPRDRRWKLVGDVEGREQVRQLRI